MPDRSGRDERESGYRALTNRDEIRRWADDNDLVPARRRDVDRRDRVELVRRDGLGEDHEEQDWDTFHESFDERNLAVVHRADAGGGSFHLVDRDEVAGCDEIDGALVEELLEGDTVRTEVTEREVVEKEVVEELTLESELVESEVVERALVDTEIVAEELVGVAVAEQTDAEVSDDADRTSARIADDADRTYLGEDDGETVEIEESGVVGLDIDETRIETEERIEEKTVETRVVETDVPGEAGVDERSVDTDIDVDNVHEHVRQSSVIDTGTGDALDQQYVETEIDGDDRATSTVREHRTIENEVTERKVVYAAIADVEIEDTELVGREEVERSLLESDETVDLSDAAAAGLTAPTGPMFAGAGVAPETAAPTMQTAERTPGTGENRVTGRLMGMDVERADGTTLGIVSDVDEDEDRIYVDEDPGLTDKLKADLHWSDEGDATLAGEQIREVRRDAVVVDEQERPS